MDLITIIKERTSYRGKYKETPVPREDLRVIMAAGLAAPSGCNKQTTSLIAIDDPLQLAQLKKCLRPSQFTTAPAYICVLTQAVVAYRDRCFNVQDYAAAIENMLLAAVGLGYQSCWVEGHITDKDAIGRQIADLLQVPADYDLVCILPVGVAAEPIGHAQKKPFSERAWFNGFRCEEEIS